MEDTIHAFSGIAMGPIECLRIKWALCRTAEVSTSQWNKIASVRPKQTLSMDFLYGAGSL